MNDISFDRISSINAGKKVIPVVKMSMMALLLSLFIVVVGVVSFIIHSGFNLGIDFESGLSETIEIKGATSIDSVRNILSPVEGVRIQNVGDSNNGIYQIRIPAKDEEQRDKKSKQLMTLLEDSFGKNNVSSLSSAFIGAKFSTSLITTSLISIAVALVLILVYIWVRFKITYALSSVICLIHDVVLLLSFILLLDIEISSVTIAAILTIIGYCLNNTIVIFDKVRENVGIYTSDKLEEILPYSVTQTFKRTIFSSITTIVAVLPIAFSVTGEIRLFAICLAIGIAIGLYSSTFVAPNLLSFMSSIKKLNK